jgi:hypothetical protein
MSSYLSNASIAGAGPGDKKAAWNAIYMGSIPCESGKGQEVVEACLVKLNASDDKVEYDCTVHMNSHNIRLVEQVHGNVLETHFMRSISSTAVVQGKGTVRGFRQKFALEDAIGSHACSLQALQFIQRRMAEFMVPTPARLTAHFKRALAGV